LSFLDHVHELDAGEGTLCSLGRLESEHGPDDPLYTAMILFDDVVEILDLPDGDMDAVLFVVAPDGHSIGLAAVDRDLFGYTVTADGLRQKALGRSLIPRLGQQEVDRLARLIDGAIQVVPLPLT
jgi:hypothetical protein